MTSTLAQTRQPMTAGQWLLLLATLAVVADVGVALLVFGEHGFTETGALLFTRYTARVSFLFFLPVFTAKALQIWVPGPLTARLIKRRRQMGLAFATAHLIHLTAILILFRIQDRGFGTGDIAALIIYGFVLAMALTSNNQSIRRLGKGWKVLHWLGMYAIFIGFFSTYWGRLGSEQVELPSSAPESEAYGIYALLAITITAAWLLRISAFWKLRLNR